MILDFTEIPQANTGSGLQDTFELFSRDCLEDFGFEILQQPDRGADGKKDIIVGETRTGVAGKSYIKWLVSCKHFAHSKKSVTQDDEPDIVDRLKSHDCNGFIGFYSTLPSTSLNTKLEGLKDNIEFYIYDRERIEKKILGFPEGIKLARRYFPISLENFIRENPKPAKIYIEEPELLCDYCGKDLLKVKNGIFVLLEEHIPDPESDWGYIDSKEKDVYFSCKGNCDIILKAQYQNKGLFDSGWEDIDDLFIPSVYLRNLMSFINNLAEDGIEKKVLVQMKKMYINIFPHIARELTDNEKERLSMLTQFWQMGLF